MKRPHITLMVAFAALALIAAGCGGGGGDAPNTSYLPLQVGNTWDYLMTLAPDLVPAQAGDNQLFDYHETVTGIATQDGVDYFLIQAVRDETDEHRRGILQQLRRESEDAILARLPIYDDAGQAIVGWYDLPLLTLPPREGDTWTNPEFPDRAFTVAAVGERVTVPAGTFSCVRVEQAFEEQLEDGSPIQHTIKTWYSRGVGLVKDETWEDDVMTSSIELTDYSVQ